MSKNQKTLLKGALLIIAIIVGCTLLSRHVLHSSQTLAEYSKGQAVVEATATPIPTAIPPTPTPSTAPDEAPENDPVMEFYALPLSEELIASITGISYPSSEAVAEPEISYEDMMYVHLLHYNFDEEVTEGELICNKSIAQDIVDIFYELYLARYQIEKVKLIDEYGGDDELSMQDNNTSCFNYRVVSGSSHLSKHAYGLAIDINPFYNPYVTYGSDGSANYAPEGSGAYADRTAPFPYKIDENDLCYKLFTQHGFTWGGNWNNVKDYQHFEYTLN